MLSLHPNPNERRRTLAETDGLFRLGFWDAFGTGVASMVAVPIVTLVLGFALPSQLEDWAPTTAALIFAPLAVGVVGLGIWRETYRAAIRDQAPRGIGRLGFALGLGLAFGQALSLNAPVMGTGATIVFNAALGAVLLVNLPCLTWWVSACARLWLAKVDSLRTLRFVVVAGVAMAGFVSTVLLGSLLWLLTTGPASLALLIVTPVGVIGVINRILQSPLLLAVLVSLWAFPMAASVLRSRPSFSTSLAHWVFLDTPPLPLALHRGQSLSPKKALALGLIGGLTFCVLLLIVRFWWSGLPDATRNTDMAKILFGVGQAVVAAVVQALTGVVVAVLVKPLGLLHGLFAAFVAGCVCAMGVLGLNLAFGGSIDLPFAWVMLSLVLNGGALISLPAAAAASVLASWFRSTGERSTGPEYTSPI